MKLVEPWIHCSPDILQSVGKQGDMSVMDKLLNKTLPFVVKAQVLMARRRAQRGQGVIEYAGALVVAAVMVAAVLAIGPTGIKSLFTDILNSVQTYMKGQLPK
jgi:hypothetical protein